MNPATFTNSNPDDPVGDYKVFVCIYMTREPRDCNNWVEKNGTACGRCLVRIMSFALRHSAPCWQSQTLTESGVLALRP